MTGACEFHYAASGKPGNPTIVLLHGFLGDHTDFDEITAGLKDDFYCVAVDLPGHGRTRAEPTERGFGMKPVAGELIDLLNSFAVDRAHLLGYSMGGRLALYIALHYPERFDRLILESASPGLKTQAERTERRQRDETLAERILQTPFDEFIAGWYEQPLFDTIRQDPERFKALLLRRHGDRAGLALSLRMMGTGVQPSLWDHLGHLALPTLLIVGEKDTKFRSIAEAMAAQVRSAEVAVVADAGHNVHFEKPARYVREVKRFLDNS